MSEQKLSTLFGISPHVQQPMATFEEIAKQFAGMRITNEPVPRVSIYDFIRGASGNQNPSQTFTKLVHDHPSLQDIAEGKYKFPGI